MHYRFKQKGDRLIFNLSPLELFGFYLTFTY